MIQHETIPDLFIAALRKEKDHAQESIRLLGFDDHLLRRFGVLEWVRKDPQELQDLSLRSKADEFWFLMDGSIEGVAKDLRPGSPSQGSQVSFSLSKPSRIMVPFGVAFGWRAVGGSAVMLRCATHAFGEHAEDRTIPVRELE